MSDEYNASSIKILSDDEVAEFDWARSEMLARDYCLPIEWVRRGYEASYRLGIDTTYFENRYIHKKPDAHIPEFSEVFELLMREDSEKRSRTR